MENRRKRIAYASPYGGESLRSNSISETFGRIEGVLEKYTTWDGGVLATLEIELLPHSQELHALHMRCKSKWDEANCTQQNVENLLGALPDYLKEAFERFGDAVLGASVTMDGAAAHEASLVTCKWMASGSHDDASRLRDMKAYALQFENHTRDELHPVFSDLGVRPVFSLELAYVTKGFVDASDTSGASADRMVRWTVPGRSETLPWQGAEHGEDGGKGCGTILSIFVPQQTILHRMVFPFEEPNAEFKSYLQSVFKDLKLPIYQNRLRSLVVTKDGQSTRYLKIQHPVVAPENMALSNEFAEYLGPRLKKTREEDLLKLFSDEKDVWPICQAILKHIGKLNGKPLARASTLLTTLLPLVVQFDGLETTIAEFLSSKPSTKSVNQVGTAFHKIVNEQAFIDLAVSMIVPVKNPNSRALSFLANALGYGIVQPTPRLAELSALILHKIREKGSTTQRHHFLRALSRFSDGHDWATWILEMHAEPKQFSVGSMQTGFVGFTWAHGVWMKMTESALSEAGQKHLEKLNPVEQEYGFDFEPISESERSRLQALEQRRITSFVSQVVLEE